MKAKPLPNTHESVILDAVLADGDKVLEGTMEYAKAVAKWTAEERRFVKSVEK